MRLLIASIAPLVLLFTTGSTAAECREYWLPADGPTVCWDHPGNLDPPPPVCFGGQVSLNPTPDGLGDVTITIHDDHLSPNAGSYCSDLDDDFMCDSDEPGGIFCGSHTLTSGDWFPGFPLLVRVNGPVFGNPIFSACGPFSPTGTMGTHGFVCAS